MSRWTILSLVSNRGKSVVDEWYAKLPVKAKIRWRLTIGYLMDQPIQNWKEPHFKQLTDGGGVGEIRFKADNVQYRPLGFFGPHGGEFTILLCAIERGGHFEPRNALDMAQKRMRFVLESREKTREYR